MKTCALFILALLFCIKTSRAVAKPQTHQQTRDSTRPATSSPPPPPSSSPSPAPEISPSSVQRFPRNLHRLYDGTWEIAVSHVPPFNYIPSDDNKANKTASHSPSPSPSPSGTNLNPEDSQRSTERHLNSLSARDSNLDLATIHQLERQRRSKLRKERLGFPKVAARLADVAFQKKTGFALLTADNHQTSTLSPNLHIVFGDLILRDGAYRTQRDVSLRLAGIYELTSGTLVFVGDVMYDTANSVLSRLYKAFSTARPSTVDDTDYFNHTEAAFTDALRPRIEKYQSQYRLQRATAPQATGVAAQCPFTASFTITPGNFDDAVPSDSELAGAVPVSPFTAAADGRHGASSGVGSGIVSDGVTAVPSMFAGRADGFDDGVNAQDEYVEMKGRFVSEKCRTEITVVLATLDTETLFGKAINYTLLVTVVAFVQVIVLIKQMEMTSTQAGARRVSLMTVGLQAVADSYLCLGHLTMGIAVQTLFNAFATAAFFKFICFSIFLMRWMLLIWKARRPSGFSEGWEAMRRELSMLYSRFYGALLVGIFLLYQLQNHVRLFVFALYSFWVPQIVLNAVEDHRRPLLPLYIICTSITRLAIPLYFWGCPHNFLHIEPQPTVALALIAWLAAQALIVLSQYKFGPRWFIPKEFLPEKYDYFRPVAVQDDEIIDLEAACDQGVNRPLVGAEHVEATRECCICMESVAIHSRDRMVTPCNHFFHAACLERWLEVRLECALCRSPVPPP